MDARQIAVARANFAAVAPITDEARAAWVAAYTVLAGEMKAAARAV